MKTISLLLLFVCAFHAQAKTDPNVGHEELTRTCGDDILCYFSESERREALGPLYDQKGIENDFKIDGFNADFLLEEDGVSAIARGQGDGATDFSARRRSEPKTKKSPGGGGLGYTGISPAGAPIWASFVGKFKQCAPGCVPYIVSVNRPGAVSCHSGGRAIDVGAIVCGGTTSKAINQGKFAKFVGCMKGKMTGLYRRPHRYQACKRNGGSHEACLTFGEYDHGHFSNGCIVSGGRRWY